jgi:hypothetical protein
MIFLFVALIVILSLIVFDPTLAIKILRVGSMIGSLVGSNDRTKTFEILLSILPMLMMGLLILFTIHPDDKVTPSSDRNITDSNQSGQAAIIWTIGVIVSLGIVGGINYLVDPFRIYGLHSIWPQVVYNYRSEKIEMYRHLAPDVIFMGSSRAFSLPAGRVQLATGLTAFNAAVAGGDIDEFLIQEKFIIEHAQSMPHVFVVDLQVPIATTFPNTALYTISMLPYTPIYQWGTLGNTKLQQLISVQQLSYTLATISYQYVPVRLDQLTVYSLKSDGQVIFTQNDGMDFKTRLNEWIRKKLNGKAYQCDTLNGDGVRLTREFLDIASRNHVSVIFYLSPWQPDYFSAMQQEDGYLTCKQAWFYFMKQLQADYPNVYFIDAADITVFGGDGTEKGFNDGHHMTELNATLFVDYLTPIIEQAYQKSVLADTSP